MAKRKSPATTVPHVPTTKGREPKPKFMLLGKSKFVHTVRTEVWDRKNASCLHVRKFMVAGKIDYKAKGLSPEAASELEGCPSCDTAGVLKSLVTPEDRKAASKARTEETLNKVRDEQKRSKRKGSLPGEDHPKSVRRSGGGSKRVATSKPKQTMVKSGPKSLGDDHEKASILGKFAEEHGWKVKITEDKPGYKLVAKRGDETITCWFDGSKYDISRMGYIEVKGSDWQGKLRAAHACRRQMAGEGRDRPHPRPGAGRSTPRSKVEEPTPDTESPEDAHRRVPFSLDDDAVAIIDVIKGHTIRWRNSLSGMLEEAVLPAQANGTKRSKIAINTHPKKAKRILSFFPVEMIGEHGEVYGGERNVALDKILRVL